jgi:predicted acetyltransferase
MDNAELNYYKAVCYIQDEFIKGEISREEMEQKLEIERLKFIEYLRKQNEALMQQTAQEKRF